MIGAALSCFLSLTGRVPADAMADKPVSIFDLLTSMKIEVSDEKVANAKLDYILLLDSAKRDSLETAIETTLTASAMLFFSRARRSGILFESAVLKEHCAFFFSMLSSDFFRGTAFRGDMRARTGSSVSAADKPAGPASSIFEGSVVTLCDVAQYLVSARCRPTD